MSIIGQICEMMEEPTLGADGPLAIGDRVRFTGDDMRDEGDACREIVGKIEAINGGHAALRDDDGNMCSVEIGWLERVETEGRAA